MRGSSLSHPAVLETLRPFIVVSWNGTSTREMPEDIWEIYRAGNLGDRGGAIRLFVLNPQGELVRAFFPFAGPSPATLGFDRQKMGLYLKREIEKATAQMDLSGVKAAEPKLRLPEVGPNFKVTQMPAGVRILLSLEHPFASSFRVPVVETVANSAAEEELLHYPQQPKTIAANSLKRWLEQIYPPAMMERSGRIVEISGDLNFRPAGSEKNEQLAILQGTVHFTFDDARQTRYQGSLAMTFRYTDEGQQMESFRGLYRGIFPKWDKQGKGLVKILMQGVLESRPD